MNTMDRSVAGRAKPALVLALVAATTIGGFTTTASAMPRLTDVGVSERRDVVKVGHRDRRHDRRDIIGAGIIGLAAGALLGGALAAPRYAPPPVTYVPRYQPHYYQPRYVAPPVVTYVPVAPQHGMPWAGGYPPYSDGWLHYCSRRYRSFDARSGTFLGYDGHRHYCR